MKIDVGLGAVAQATKELSNWGKWGADDQIGTLNYVTPDMLVAASRLVRKGAVFALGIPLDGTGPQTGLWGRRFNPIHMMLQSGTDGILQKREAAGLCNYSDDVILLCIQGGTHWDALGHVFCNDKMYNGYDAALADGSGIKRNAIQETRNKMAGRGVLLDIARFKGLEVLPDGYGISNAELDACAAAQGVTIGRGDFVILRTGQMEARIKAGAWGGYAGGDAPGVKFENCYWAHAKQIAAICSDTWGVEVRPNETRELEQPWHWVVIPAMGLTMGEMFHLKDLAEDCAADGVYEFFFCAPPLNITGASGSPINPQVFK
jgi:kynurenine formamidase